MLKRIRLNYTKAVYVKGCDLIKIGRMEVKPESQPQESLPCTRTAGSPLPNSWLTAPTT